MKDVPWASKDLKGSSLSVVTERQHLVDSIAEITLLCNEATRRQKQNGTSTVAKKTTKPLSIEYIFDRIDTDDPILGFMVRTDQPMSFKGRPSTAKNSPNWKRGMLQGFITMTTFTNWQTSFRFDSLHEMAFAHDDKDLEFQMDNGMRKVDEDGSLADELEATVKGGNPHVEGIVYPRIAELSLFGGLGCGKQLLSLLIEHLECMKGSDSKNYDYILLQATENSVPFYESMGFIRVGCVQGTSPSPNDYTSGPVEEYHTQKNGETPASIANLFGVDSGDVVFLNKPLYLTLMKNSWLKKGTKIFVPAVPKAQKSDAKITSKALRWYVADENETLRGISKKLEINFSDLLRANKARFPELTGTSRLMDGTRIQISRFDQIDVEEMIPYSHWTFPDAETDDNEPSYMMALRLNRRKGNEAKFKPVATSFAVPIQPFSPQATGAIELLQEPSTQVLAPVASARKLQPPPRPKRPPTSYAMFCSEYRAKNPNQLNGLPVPDAARIISDNWKAMSKEEKAPYVERYHQSRAAHGVAMKIYNEEMEAFNRVSSSGSSADATLLEKVVKLKPSSDEIRTPKFDYYYVLTYIPDLQWVHLIPLRKVGEFGQENPHSSGRPIWMIVGEDEGKEIDTTAARCEVVTAVTVRNSADADLEQWDIYDGEDAPFEVHPDPARSSVHTPRKPKKPLNSFSLFCIEARIKFKSELVGVPSTEATKLISAKWRAMSVEEKGRYKDLHNAEKAKYEVSLKNYEDELARFQIENPGRGPKSSPAKAPKSAKKSDSNACRETIASDKAKRGRGRPRKSDVASVTLEASSAKSKSKTAVTQPKSAKVGRPRKSDEGIVSRKQRSTIAVPPSHDGVTPKKRKRGRPRKKPEQPVTSASSVVSASPKAAILEVESDPAAIERMLNRIKREKSTRNSPRVRSRSEPPAPGTTRQHIGPPPGDGDVILSLTDPYYKQILYQHYKLLGTSRDLQHEGRVCDEILGVFRKRIGRKGRYFKRPRSTYPHIQVDESTVLKKIKSDIVRRNESAAAWDVNEESTNTVKITSTPRKKKGSEEVKPKSQKKVKQTPSQTKKQHKMDRSEAVVEKSLETGGRGDVVLSTLSSTYKSKLYATYRSMGAGKVGTEVERDRGMELLSSLKRNLGRNGHFYKKSNQSNDLVQIDEEEALGKICRDINRRKETWHLWRQGESNASSNPSPKRSRPDNNGPSPKRARYPRRGGVLTMESKPKLAPIFLKCYKKKRPVVSDQGSDEEPSRKRSRH